MASPGAGDVVVKQYMSATYVGQVRPGAIWGNMRHGHGVMTWTDDARFDGEYRNDKRHGRGVMWHADGRVFDGAWAGGFPLSGTAMEADGSLFLAVYDNRTCVWDGWGTAVRTPAGRVVDGRPPRDEGGRWRGTVEDAGGARYAGELRWLRPCGAGLLTDGGAQFRVEYADGAATLAEGDSPGRMPAPGRREVRARAPRVARRGFRPPDGIVRAGRVGGWFPSQPLRPDAEQPFARRKKGGSA